MSKEMQLALANEMVLMLWEKDLITDEERDEIMRKNKLKILS